MKKIEVRYNLSLDNIHTIENELIKQKKNFITVTTSYSAQIICEKKKFIFSKNTLGYGALNIILQTKLHILKRINEGKFEIKKVKPEFYRYNPAIINEKSGMLFGNYEVDINSAYILSAFFQGIIDEKLYKKLKGISKKLRLQALGSIAVKKNITEIQEGKVISYRTEQNEQLTDVWKMISKGCDELIMEMVDEKHFIFFWFDNLFTQSVKHLSKDIVYYKVKNDIDISYEKRIDSLKLLINNSRKQFNLPL